MKLYTFPVAGLKFHNFHDIKDTVKPGDKITLIPEPDNEYDPNAIRIHYGNTMIGYVPKKWTDVVREAMNNNHLITIHEYDEQKPSHMSVLISVETI